MRSRLLSYAYINYAVHEKWINGYDDNTFRPDNYITRAEAVTVVNRVLERQADEDYINAHQSEMRTYTDLTSEHWAYYDIMEASVNHDCTKPETGEAWQ